MQPQTGPSGRPPPDFGLAARQQGLHLGLQRLHFGLSLGGHSAPHPVLRDLAYSRAKLPPCFAPRTLPPAHWAPPPLCVPPALSPAPRLAPGPRCAPPPPPLVPPFAPIAQNSTRPP